ncbi:hypothetical protein L1049_019174 [Liquidambar formosana]|uniref:Xyloglucan endotransglucosylase/hydrolase n=1 Tax=Liquidambar formosana TaxID=63359 RepID=A0AAP0WPQ3_LIQFO
MVNSYSYLLFLLVCIHVFLASGSPQNLNLPTSTFDEGFQHLYGDDHVFILENGKSVHISLDSRTGSGFISQDQYLYGYFSASIKLPSDYTAGVVVTFYTSNQELYETNHDELDFEFLGNIRGQSWVVQSNIYGNGSISRGREERYGLWFDPTEDFHQYSILWTGKVIIFYVDNVPIRVVKRTEAMGGDFPSKPMSLYATIWDGSNWATSGGKYKVDYKYAPFIAKFSDLVLGGCAIDPIEKSSTCDYDTNFEAIISTGVTPKEISDMENFRKKYMTYSYCYHRSRYPTPLPECVIKPQEAEQLRRIDPYVFGGGLVGM